MATVLHGLGWKSPGNGHRGGGEGELQSKEQNSRYGWIQISERLAVHSGFAR